MDLHPGPPLTGMVKGKSNNNVNGNYVTVEIGDVPKGRRGKHHVTVENILTDVAGLKDGSALRVPLESFGRVKLANVRAALSRAAKQRELSIVTTSDGEHLFIWRGNDKISRKARQ